MFLWLDTAIHINSEGKWCINHIFNVWGRSHQCLPRDTTSRDSTTTEEKRQKQYLIVTSQPFASIAAEFSSAPFTHDSPTYSTELLNQSL